MGQNKGCQNKMADLVFQNLLKRFLFDSLISLKLDEKWCEIVLAGLETCRLNELCTFEEIEQLRGIVTWLPNNSCKICLIRMILLADRDEKYDAPDLTLLEEFCISLAKNPDPLSIIGNPYPLATEEIGLILNNFNSSGCRWSEIYKALKRNHPKEFVLMCLTECNPLSWKNEDFDEINDEDIKEILKKSRMKTRSHLLSHVICLLYSPWRDNHSFSQLLSCCTVDGLWVTVDDRIYTTEWYVEKKVITLREAGVLRNIHKAMRQSKTEFIILLW